MSSVFEKIGADVSILEQRLKALEDTISNSEHFSTSDNSVNATIVNENDINNSSDDQPTQEEGTTEQKSFVIGPDGVLRFI